MSKVALLGLGAMGQRIGQRLLDAEHDLTVWNRSPEPAQRLHAKGATVATSPREAVKGAHVVIGMVTDDTASREVWLHPELGALYGLNREAIAIEMSTLTPAWCTELAGLVTLQGAAFLDAPVVGSRPQAEAGQLVQLVGGASETLARVSQVLACMSAAVHHVGPHGAGAFLKLVVNALFGIQVLALGELLGLARRGRLDVTRAIEVLGSLAVTSPAAKGAAALMQARRFDPLFPIALVEKDFRYALELAQQHEAETPLTMQAHELFWRAGAHGLGEENITAAAKLFE